MYGEVSDVLQAQGFILRNETVIDESYSGVLSYRVADGSRVSRGGVIADIFSNESDAASQRELDQLDQEIENLQSLSQTANFYVANPSMLGDQIYSALEGISQLVNENDFSGLNTQKGRAAECPHPAPADYRRGERGRLQPAHQQLQSQRDTRGQPDWLCNGEYPGPGSGLLYQHCGRPGKCDGYFPGGEHYSGPGGGAFRAAASSTDAVGKICQDFNWYAVCVFDEDDMVHFEGVEDVYLDIPFASTEQIPAKVLARNSDGESGKTAVVFQCSTMDADIAAVRNEAIQVTVNTYSGVLVNERAIRFADVEYTTTDEAGNTVTQVQENVKGVYVLYGGQLEFVQVFTDQTVNGYAICRTDLTEEEQSMLVTDSTIQLYDQVVVEGTDLYDGKIVR
mgnify:CR=1 FL=1